jgi:hypothetical protein
MTTVRFVSVGLLALLLPAAAVSALPPGPHCPPPSWDQEPNDSLSQASPVGRPPLGILAVPVAGTIDPAGDVDYFRVSMQAGERLWILVDTGVPAIGTRDSFVRVLSPSGALLDWDDDDGTSVSYTTGAIVSLDSSAIAGLAVPVTGDYFVEVTAGVPGQLMSYRLMVAITPNQSDLEFEPNDDSPSQPSFLWNSVLGQVGPGDVDRYLIGALDTGFPLVIANGAVDPSPVDLKFTFEFPSLVVDSSQQPSIRAEAVALREPGPLVLKVTGATLSGTAGRYRFGIFYTGDTCPVPVTLQSFAVE